MTKSAKKTPSKKPALKKAPKNIDGKTSCKTSSPAGLKKPGSKKPQKKSEDLHHHILKWLDDDKAQDIVSIDIQQKTSIGDWMIIASGTSSRHIKSLATHVVEKLKDIDIIATLDGVEQADWVLIDAGDVIVHLFKDQVRAYYDLESMWRIPIETGD
ncbi:MAG: ribosome silencing factor [Pseudomonadota bacterium]